MKGAAAAKEDEDKKKLDNETEESSTADEERVPSLSNEELTALASLLEDSLTINSGAQELKPLLKSADLQGVAEYIRSGKAKNIICMCGAGISVSAGIPDFRSPASGLYSKLKKLGLSQPEEVFSLKHFKIDPQPFYAVAKEIAPGNFKPTPTHHFMSLLESKGLLLRCYTQNIDSLETLANVDPDLVVAAHGNFEGAHCVDCHAEASTAELAEKLKAGEIAYCAKCGGYIKPDIVFFGENLPTRFFRNAKRDLPKCDLLIVMGTSLVVYPFAALADEVSATTPRLLINRERVGDFDFGDDTCRDVFYQGDCDDGIWLLAKLLGWTSDLQCKIDTSAAET